MSEAQDDALVLAFSKNSGMYPAMLVQARKGQPDAGDVHAPAAAAGKGGRKKKPMIPATVDGGGDMREADLTKALVAKYAAADPVFAKGDAGLYVSRPLTPGSAQRLHDWAVAAGMTNVVPPQLMHVTQVHSKDAVDGLEPLDTLLDVDDEPRWLSPLGDKGALVMFIDSPEMTARFKEAAAAGAVWDFQSYRPHITLSYDAGHSVEWGMTAAPDFPIQLGPEKFEASSDTFVEDNGLRKGEFEFAVGVTKVDQVQQMIFGWASVSSVSGEDIIDKQGDVIPIGSLEKGVYDYVLYSREHGDMHSKVGSGKLIESMVFTPEKASAGIAAKNDNGEPMMGWWVGFKVNDKPTWDAIASGDRPELSIGGRATSVEKGYNDDEPRDDHGRWSDGGGGDESRSPGRDASKPQGDGSVDDYVSRLEASVHNANAFPALHGELANDENLSVNDVKSINRQFTGNRATSKAQALKQIWNAHQEVMTTRARALATAGRTAA